MKRTFPAHWLVVAACLALLVVSPRPSGAANPVIDTLPDLHLVVGSSAPLVLDLNRFVSDFEHVDFERNRYEVSWFTNAILPAAPLSLSSGRIVSLDEATVAGDGGLYLFSVRDAGGLFGGAEAAFHSSTVSVADPWNIPDPRVNPTPSTARFVNLMDPEVGGSGIWEATGLLAVSSPGAVNWPGIFVSRLYDAAGNYDPNRTTIASGNPVGIQNTMAAAAPAGGNFIVSAGDQFEGPYLVGFRAVNAQDSDDWDGASILVSGTVLSSSSPFMRGTPDYARDERFENMHGRLNMAGLNGLTPNPVGSNVLPGPARCSWVHQVGVAGNIPYGSATVVHPGEMPPDLAAPDASFFGDHSGNALRITVWPNRPLVYVRRFAAFPQGRDDPTGVPGRVRPNRLYAVDASLASNSPHPDLTPLLRLALAAESYSEYTETALGSGALPGAGEGWIQLRAHLEPSNAALNANPPGLQIVIAVVANPLAAGPVDVYVDNVRLYPTAYDMDLARGATRERMIGAPHTRFPGPVYGDFEQSQGELFGNQIDIGGNLNGWFLLSQDPYGGAPAGTFAGVTSSDGSTMTKAGDSNWLEFMFSPGMAQPELLIARSPDLVSPTGGAVDGIYELRADYITPAGAGLPVLNLAVAARNFQSFSRLELSAAGQAEYGGRRTLRVPAALRGSDGLVAMVAPFGSTIPPADVSVFVDNVQVHRLNDRPEYWDRTLFQSAP